MQCPVETKDGREWLIRRGSGVLSNPLDEELERHAAGCAECHRIIDAQREVWSMLDAWEAEPISEDFDARLYARIAADRERPWYRRMFDVALPLPWKPAMPLAAACALLAGAFLLQGPVFNHPADRPTVHQASMEVEIESVERALDDVDMLNKLGVVPPPSRQNAHPETL